MIINGIEYNGTGGRSFKPMPKRTSWEMLNLLELLLKKNRKTIKNEFCKRGLKLDYEGVVKFLDFNKNEGC